MASTGPHTGGRRRPIVIAISAVALAVALAAVAVLNLARAPANPRDAAPAAYYAVAERGDSRLIRLPLDGQTPASTVATHRQPLVGYGSWSVSPDGHQIAWIEVGAVHSGAAGNSTQLDLLATGSNDVAWSVTIDGAVDPSVLWSTDGRWLAGQTSEEGQDRRVIRNFVTDLTARQVAVHAQTEPASPVGIASDGALILGEPIADAQGHNIDWRFSRVDPASGEATSIAAADALTDPGMTLSREVNARAGGFINVEATQTAPDGDQVGEHIAFHGFGAGRAVELARIPTRYDNAMFLPDGTGVLASVRGIEAADGRTPSSIVLIGLDGKASQLWSGDFATLDYLFSAQGDMVGLTGWTDRSRLIVIDLQTTIAVEVPIAAGVTEAELVRIVGGARIPPDEAIAATAAPSPSATAAAETAQPLAGGARAYAFAYETAPDGKRTAQIALLAPAADGLVAVTDRMPPIPLNGSGDDAEVNLVVAPGGGQTLVIETSGDAIVQAWVWRPPAAPQSIDLPAGWPSYPTPIWRPDGRALASVRDDAVLWFELGNPVVRDVTIPEFRPDFGAWYVEPAAWTVDGRSIVLGPSHCTDGCGFDYPTIESLDLATGVATPYGPASSVDARATGPLGRQTSVRSGMVAYVTEGGLTLFDRYEDPGNLRVVAWPPAAGELERDVAVPFWSEDGSRMFIQGRTAGTQHVFRLDDPVSAASTPHDIGLLPDEWRLEDVEPAQHWAVAMRVGDVWGFVDLATGAVHEVPGQWSFAGFAALP